MFIDLEREEGKERERNINVREKHRLGASYTHSNPGSNLCLLMCRKTLKRTKQPIRAKKINKRFNTYILF